MTGTDKIMVLMVVVAVFLVGSMTWLMSRGDPSGFDRIDEMISMTDRVIAKSIHEVDEWSKN